jgi:O-glycosyl hydrolase
MFRFIKMLLVYLLFLLSFTSCKKKNGGDPDPVQNRPPVASITAEIISTDPITYQFNVRASDPDNDKLTYSWDFGEGTKKTGNAEETFNYDAEKDFLVKVSVSDGKANPVALTYSISTRSTIVTIDLSKKYQTIEGFGGFGAKMEYWASGPFEDDAFINTLLDDLGLTILRDNLTTSFEPVNDNSDPFDTDLTKFNLANDISGADEPLSDHLAYLKKMHASGLEKMISSVWSPPSWMKHNNMIGNGTTDQTSAPPYTTNPTTATNQLKPAMYEEFAEMCVAYIKIIKRETGIDIYALSVQNEPRFSQFYSSAVYNGDALRDLIKVVGKRFEDEGIQTKLFLPEDVGWLDGVESMLTPTLADPEARKYVDIVAVHGYDLDGVTAASTSAATWQTMYNWGAKYNVPLWMTETSGYANNYQGAMDLAKAMYTALKFGNVSAWVFWSLSTSSLNEFSLMSSSGEKSKRYYISKNFYRYIRPGAVRREATAADAGKIYPLSFKNDVQNTITIVLINDNPADKLIKLDGTGLPSVMAKFVTSESENTADKGDVNPAKYILLPANSLTTLYK